MNVTQSLLFSVIPKSVEQLSKQLHTKIIDANILQSLINLAILYWKGEELKVDEWNNIIEKSYLPLSMFEEIFSGVLTLTMATLQMPDKLFIREAVCDELLQFGLTVAQAEQIMEAKSGASPNIPNFLKIKNTNWRIDVTISTSDVSRILEPWILLELTLTTGDKKVIHIPVAQFHSLRYQVASCLSQLSKLNGN